MFHALIHEYRYILHLRDREQVHEKGERGWWLPGGGIDDGESPIVGANREAREEAGVNSFVANSMRVLRCELSPGRMRWLLAARAASAQLKNVPDDESRGAEWRTLAEVEALAADRAPSGTPHPWLRGDEPLSFFRLLDSGFRGHALDAVEFQCAAGALNYHGRAAYKTVCELVFVVPCSDDASSFMIDAQRQRLPSITVNAGAGNLHAYAAGFCVRDAAGVRRVYPTGMAALCLHQRSDASAVVRIVYTMALAPPEVIARAQFVALPAVAPFARHVSADAPQMLPGCGGDAQAAGPSVCAHGALVDADERRWVERFVARGGPVLPLSALVFSESAPVVCE
jgi:ADP-ribose pyrophosphatase YjhB (NUDIX family)